MENKNIIILIPVYNDWKALNLLLNEMIKVVPETLTDRLEFVIVDDGSDNDLNEQIPLKNKIEIIRLVKNMGHQKAIAIGLSYISKNKNAEAIIIMDADGEDKPEYIKSLIENHDQNPGQIIFSQRTKRKENCLYKLCYLSYKVIFRILIGKKISFGNFCIIPSDLLSKVVMQNEIWFHFSGGIIKSKIPYSYIKTEKGKRLDGRSKMNFSSLVLFGLSAIATHQEIVVVRIILFCSIIIFLTIIGFVTVLFKKYIIHSVIPGWSSTMLGALLIILMQVLLVSLISIFLMLNNKNQKGIIPIKAYTDYLL
jgi:polyisoprenyl-phosphate glycosyltransferase